MTRRYVTWLIALGTLAAVSGLPGAAHGQAKFLGRDAKEWATQLSTAKDDPMARRSAAFALGKLGAQSTGQAPLLARHLREDMETDADVREAAAFALGEIGRGAASPEMLNALAEVLKKDAEPGVRRGAATALGLLGAPAGSQPAVKQALLEALQHQDPRVRQNAAWAVGKIGGPVLKDAMPLLNQLLTTEKDPIILRDTVSLLVPSGIALHPALPGMAHILQGNDAVLRNKASQALAKYTEQLRTELDSLQKKLEEAPNREEEEKFQKALAAANEVADKAVQDMLPALRQALKDDPDASVREFTAFSLWKLGKGAREALPEMVEAIKKNVPQFDPKTRKADPDRIAKDNLRQHLARALINLEDAVEPAVQDIAPILDIKKEPDSIVRKSIAVALSWVDLKQEKFNDAKKLLIDVALNPQEPPVVRYQAAYIVGIKLEEEGGAVTDVLLALLKDTNISEQKSTESNITTSREGSKGGTRSEEVRGNTGRILAAHALGKIGAAGAADKAAKVKEALEKAKQDRDPLLRQAAEDALVKGRF
jgi:HEAT repeat protein